MKLKNKELFKILNEMSIPVAYSNFQTDTNPPFIVFIQNGSDNFGADNIVYNRGNNYRVELYTKKKDFNLEEKLEDIFDKYEIYWEKSSDIRIEKENITEVIYFI